MFLRILLMLALSLPALAQSPDTSRRLILKDGSYQLITKYEVKGDRVRYYSSEREDWEELPNSLVDWTATEQWEKDRASLANSAEAARLDKELEHEEEVAAAKLPEVAPNLRLPMDSGVFLLDSFQGSPELNEIQQSMGDVNQDRKANIFRGIVPISGAKASIELDGAHAAIQSHVGVPSLYINIDDVPDSSSPSDSSPRVNADAPGRVQPQQPQQPEQPTVPFDRFRIVRAEVKEKKRVVGDIKRAVSGKVSQEQHYSKTTITRIAGGWFKVTPTEPLPPGEYALVEMSDSQAMNLYVWDFGVNPKAPANKNPWKPETKPETKPEAAPAANPDAKPPAAPQ